MACDGVRMCVPQVLEGTAGVLGRGRHWAGEGRLRDVLLTKRIRQTQQQLGRLVVAPTCSRPCTPPCPAESDPQHTWRDGMTAPGCQLTVAVSARGQIPGLSSVHLSHSMLARHLQCCAGLYVQVGAFLLARYLVRDLVVHYVSKKWPKWELVDHMLVRIWFDIGGSVSRGHCGELCSSNSSAGSTVCLQKSWLIHGPVAGVPAPLVVPSDRATRTALTPQTLNPDVLCRRRRAGRSSCCCG